MSARSEELLAMLAWTTEQWLFPSIRRFDESFEGWQSRTRWPQRLRRLEKRGLVTRVEHNGRLWWRLTQLGRLQALGGRDPLMQRNRDWDGRWRMFIFDLPVAQTALRQRLLRWLRKHGFGYLQDSTWISPDPFEEITDALKDFREDVEAFTLMEARHVGGAAPLALVKGAWNFRQINQRYNEYLQFLKSGERLTRNLGVGGDPLVEWLRQEQRCWQHAFTTDPLLPRKLWPPDYQGEQAWTARQATLKSVMRQLPRSFR